MMLAGVQVASGSTVVVNEIEHTTKNKVNESNNKENKLLTEIPTMTEKVATSSNASELKENISLQDAKKNFMSRTPEKEPVDICFSNITYTVTLGINKGYKQILHGVHGRLQPKQLVAIMGPSGAGKSTLLDVLSGYKVTGVGGAIYVNGRGRKTKTFKRMSCYIQQDDRLQSLLTVGENMRLASDLKLPTDLDKYDKGEIVEHILTTLGLYEHLNTRAAKLSGGQKKRLSIALELINNPLVMFLDEPTTGLDSSSCTQVVQLCKNLAHQGRTIVCTVHQPSASLFAQFDMVYVLSEGRCLYQGATKNLVPYLDEAGIPCPIYHNPADYIIELACGEYGDDKMHLLTNKAENGRALNWFDNSSSIPDMETLRQIHPLSKLKDQDKSPYLEETSPSNQRKVLLKRGFLKAKRDWTLTHLRIAVNVLTGIMLGSLFISAGNESSRMLDNYNLLFAILMHHMMSPMMLTILTFPSEMSVLVKEHFNRWYSLGSYYISITIVDLPISIICCLLFSVIVYTMSSQPLEITRFAMFFTISMFVVLVAQSFGLMIGAAFDVVNGTFLGPTLSVPMMMFAGFGVSLKDLPLYLHWGSYVSYLRYGLEGYVDAIYGLNRPKLECQAVYCHYKSPLKFLEDVGMSDGNFWMDVGALTVTVIILRIAAFLLLMWKVSAVRQ